MELPQMKIVGISPVGVSRFVGNKNDKCLICFNDLMTLCSGCTIGESDHTECKMIVGGCAHSFHYHCHARMLKATPDVTTCIACRVPWVLEKIVDLASTGSS